MFYRAVKENDGTYSIRSSEFGGNFTIVKIGVRACNVNRIIARLHKTDLMYERMKSHASKKKENH